MTAPGHLHRFVEVADFDREVSRQYPFSGQVDAGRVFGFETATKTSIL